MSYSLESMIYRLVNLYRGPLGQIFILPLSVQQTITKAQFSPAQVNNNRQVNNGQDLINLQCCCNVLKHGTMKGNY